MTSESDTDRFFYERKLLDRQIRPIAGIDEAGRGPLAGPVVAAAVILPEVWVREAMPQGFAGLNDSKKLTPTQRDRFFEFLTSDAPVEYAVSSVTADKVDEWNVLNATHFAMAHCLSDLSSTPAHVLVDGLWVESLGVEQTPIVKGDSKSYSIAAASIIAKVTRDRFMIEMDEEYPQYGFARHKGYGTKAHFEALREHGPCPIHRMSFEPVRSMVPPE